MTDLPFVSALVQADLPVWEQCLQTEFLQKMENGILSEDCFKSYLVEDSLYLREYAKIFAWGMTKATTMAAMRTYYSLLSFVQENEDLTRLRYLEQYGLREADIQSLPLRPESRAYLDCMIDAARTGEGEAECLMACLPCMLSYGWLFQKLLQRSPAVKDTYYGALVLDYAGPGYDAACRAWAERAEVACTGLSPERAARCRAIFRACSEHELRFWEMCAAPGRIFKNKYREPGRSADFPGSLLIKSLSQHREFLDAIALHQDDGRRGDLLAADRHRDGGRAGHRGHGAHPPQRLVHRDTHLCAQHRLPDGTALRRLLLQGGKLPCPVLGAEQPGRHSSQKLFQHRLQTRVVLRRVFRGEHQHHIAGVGILALQLCAAQSICQRCAGAAKGSGVQRKLHRLLLCPGNCQRHRALPRRCGLIQAAAQTFQRRAALHQPPGVVPCQHRIAGIQRLQNEVRGAGRAEQRQRPPHSRFVLHRGIVRQMQIRAAGDHRQGLVGRVAAHGRTLRDGVAVLRQKAQIGAVGVIHQQRHALRPADRRQRREFLAPRPDNPGW